MQVSAEISKSLIAGAFSLVGTMVTLVVAWARDLSISAQRTRALDEATKRAVFWDTWLKSYLAISQDPQEISAAKDKTQHELATVALTVEHLFRPSGAKPHELLPPSDEPQMVSARPLAWFPRFVLLVRRWFLLYRPARPIAWLPRLFFYTYVAVLLTIPLKLKDPEWRSLLLGSVILIAAFRGLAVWTEKPHIHGHPAA